MKVGDLVRAIAAPTGQLVGLITKVVTEESNVFQTPQYWVQLHGKNTGPYPFLEHQLEVISRVSTSDVKENCPNPGCCCGACDKNDKEKLL